MCGVVCGVWCGVWRVVCGMVRRKNMDESLGDNDDRIADIIIGMKQAAEVSVCSVVWCVVCGVWCVVCGVV